MQAPRVMDWAEEVEEHEKLKEYLAKKGIVPDAFSADPLKSGLTVKGASVLDVVTKEIQLDEVAASEDDRMETNQDQVESEPPGKDA